MSDEQRKELSPDELEQANGDPLPDREAMSVIPFPDPTLPVEPPAEQ